MCCFRDEKEYGGDKEVVEELFVKACRDFHSPKIYLEYAQSACGVSIAHAEEVTLFHYHFIVFFLINLRIR